MFFTFVRSAMRRLALLVLGAALVSMAMSATAIAIGPVVNPLISDRHSWRVVLLRRYSQHATLRGAAALIRRR